MLSSVCNSLFRSQKGCKYSLPILKPEIIFPKKPKKQCDPLTLEEACDFSTSVFCSCPPVHVLHFCSNLMGCHSAKIMSHVFVLIVNAFLKICGGLSNNVCS